VFDCALANHALLAQSSSARTYGQG
jgi:hypothetical protein